jgi:sulfoxide reductase heme-binding subunit YedZ
MDAKNSPIQHGIVAIASLSVIAVFRFVLEMPWPMAFARTSFILLFLILIIGPLMKLGIPKKKSSLFAAPWNWRGELGIWFTLTAAAHFILLWLDRPLGQMIKIGGSGYGLANFIGLVALVWALLLAITSLNKIILFIGLGSWKWLHSFTYVVLYLSAAHIAYFQFFSTYGDEVGPDWFGYTVAAMTVIVVMLQLTAFVSEVSTYRKKVTK